MRSKSSFKSASTAIYLEVSTGTTTNIHNCVPLPEDNQHEIWLPLGLRETRFDVYETICPQQMLVHKGGQIKNWSGECRDVIPTKLQCQAIQRALQSPNLQREII